MTVEPLTLTTTDGVSLEAELAAASDDGEPRAGMVLCHPHPQYGGTMRSIVISALFSALPDTGITCLRFNFRGVEGSRGTHDLGDRERLDTLAAIEVLSARLPQGTPLVLCGWSFGADIALSVHEARIAAWLAIAAPMRSIHDLEVIARDPRPKLLALAQHDEVRPPEAITAEVEHWSNTQVEIIPGASHFFVGATEKLVVLARDFVARVVR